MAGIQNSGSLPTRVLRSFIGMLADNATMELMEGKEEISKCATIAAIPVIEQKSVSSHRHDLELKPAAEEAELPLRNDFFWEALLYIPIVLQSAFGTLYIVRSLVLGHILNRLLAPRWELLQKEAEVLQKSHSFPPPSFLFLAALTIFALVVHPDGLTWIILRKLRDGIMSILRASCFCWQMVLHDHGAAISTILALATFACLFFFIYVLHKTLSPRPAAKPCMKSLPVKKKKRKGNHGRRPKPRTAPLHAKSDHQDGERDVSEASQQEDEHDGQEDDHDGQEDEQERQEDEQDRQEDKQPSPLEHPLPALLEDLPVVAPPLQTVSGSTDTADTPLPQSHIFPRERAMSNSTVDSFATYASGDHSLGSVSGRSTPTLAAPQDIDPKGRVAVARPRSSNPRKVCSRRRLRKTDVPTTHHIMTQHTMTHQPKTSLPAASSRWDALKPENTRQGQVLYSPPRMSFPRNTTNSVKPASPRSVGVGGSEIIDSPALFLPLKRAPTDSTFPPAVSRSPLPPSPLGNQSLSVGMAVTSREHVGWPSSSSPPRYVAPSGTPFASCGASPAATCLAPTSNSSPRYESSSSGYFASSSSITSAASFATSPFTTSQQLWNVPYSNIPAPPGLAPPSSPFAVGLNSHSSQFTSRVKMNPFASDEEDQLSNVDDDRIEAELQELGGRIVGSILDC